MPQMVQIQPVVDLDEILHHRRAYFRAPTAAARPAKEEQGAVAHADQAIGASGQHGFQGIFGERGFARGSDAPRGVGPAHPAQELLNCRTARRIGDTFHLMGLWTAPKDGGPRY